MSFFKKIADIGSGFLNAVGHAPRSYESEIDRTLRLLKTSKNPHRSALVLRAAILHLGRAEDEATKKAKIGELVDVMRERGFFPATYSDIGSRRYDDSEQGFTVAIQHALHQLKQDGTISMGTLRLLPGGFITRSEMTSPMVR